MVYTDGDIIIKEHNNNDEQNAFFILFKGEVELFSGETLNRNVLARFNKKGNFFGEIGFFTGLPRNASAISNGISVLIKLERDTFL